VTLEALNHSIAHWEKNAQALDPIEASLRARDCALCRLYRVPKRSCKKAMNACQGCPIMKTTGVNICLATPYIKANFAYENWCTEETEEARAAFQAACQDEIDFLKKVRHEHYNV
jgi:hypothetical protein